MFCHGPSGKERTSEVDIEHAVKFALSHVPEFNILSVNSSGIDENIDATKLPSCFQDTHLGFFRARNIHHNRFDPRAFTELENALLKLVGIRAPQHDVRP